MIQRDRLIALGLALAMLGLGVLVLFVPAWILGVGILALGAFELAIARRADDWAILDVVVGIWLLLLGGTTIVTPEWGIPLLFITAGAQLVRAAGDIGMVINLSLVAILAYSRGAPSWSIAILVIAAVGKLLWYLREHFRYDTPFDPTST